MRESDLRVEADRSKAAVTNSDTRSTAGTAAQQAVLPDSFRYCTGCLSRHGLQGRVLHNMLDRRRQVCLGHLSWARPGVQGEAL